MDRLWAPWRMEYIEKIYNGDGCFLCGVISEKNDKKNLILHRGKESFVVMNRYPYNAGHLMISPYKHTADIMDVTDECRAEILKLTGESVAILKKTIEAQGFNCGLNLGRVGGAGLLDHFHMHVVPRWAGDTNFFPVLGNTKSMPEFLEDTYDRLIGEFNKIKD